MLFLLLSRIPYHRGGAYNAHRGNDILRHWNKIPDDADIVITHGPPAGKFLKLLN